MRRKSCTAGTGRRCVPFCSGAAEASCQAPRSCRLQCVLASQTPTHTRRLKCRRKQRLKLARSGSSTSRRNKCSDWSRTWTAARCQGDFQATATQRWACAASARRTRARRGGTEAAGWRVDNSLGLKGTPLADTTAWAVTPC